MKRSEEEGIEELSLLTYAQMYQTNLQGRIESPAKISRTFPGPQSFDNIHDTCVLALVLYKRAGIIASKRCNNVEIYDNEVYDGGDEAVGIFLHRSSDDALVHGEPWASMRRMFFHP